MGNLCTFNSASSHHGYNPVQEATDELLVEALRKGKFEDALYYAKSGADATCDLGSRFFDSNCKKPLDYLVKNGRDNNETYRNDVFTPQQRVRIFRELVKNIENPLDLVSDKTLDNALAWGRAEIIPELKAIGVKIESRHFVEAANPIHRRNNALKTMKAMLPYVKDVNVTDPFTGENAGHVVAGKLDLEAFQWLEKKGLKKDAFAKKIWPSTYAHKAATSDIFDKKEEEKRIEFASYLVEKGYPIDTPGRDNRTPTEDAINQRHVGAALVYLNAGTEVKPEYLSRAIIATHFGRTTTTAKDIIAIGEKLAEKNISPQANRVKAKSCKSRYPVKESAYLSGISV